MKKHTKAALAYAEKSASGRLARGIKAIQRNASPRHRTSRERATAVDAANKPGRKKSALAKQAEKLFPVQHSSIPMPAADPYPAYYGELRVVQTVTTYSACEDPIPNPYKKH